MTWGARCAAVLSAVAMPATAGLAQQSPSTATGKQAMAPASDRKICRGEGRSGSHLIKKRCLLQSEWAEIDRRKNDLQLERRYGESFVGNPQATPF